MWNDEREPTATPPRATTPNDVVGAAEQAAYDAACQCDDTYGDYPWCPACYPTAVADAARAASDD